jgi:hypothetical protein
MELNICEHKNLTLIWTVGQERYEYKLYVCEDCQQVIAHPYYCGCDKCEKENNK